MDDANNEITIFVKKMILLSKETEENVPQPNECARLFAAIHHVLTDHYDCPFLATSIDSDHGWPCPRNFDNHFDVYYARKKRMEATVIKDITFYYLLVNFPESETAYIILDTSPILPLFESPNEYDEETPEEGVEDNHGSQATTIYVGLYVSMMAKLISQIGHHIFSRMYVLVFIPAYYVLSIFPLDTSEIVEKN